MVDLIESVKAGSLQALAKLLTRLEREGPRAFEAAPELLNPQHQAFRIGITGPPGAGKSTLIARLIREFRDRNHKVGVLAVDPSSPFSKGAVLGDRIRYADHFNDPGVFIRSLGSRGSLGGLSSSTYLMVRAFDLAGIDTVLIETVGVGQTELEIMNVADQVAVVLVPESGDAIQGMKAGLLEIADCFLVNKGDRPGAEAFASELRGSLQLSMQHSMQHSMRQSMQQSMQQAEHASEHAGTVRIFMTTATTGQGIREFVDDLEQSRATTDEKGQLIWQALRNSAQRLRSEAVALLRNQAERDILMRVQSIQNREDFAALLKLR